MDKPPPFCKVLNIRTPIKGRPGSSITGLGQGLGFPWPVTQNGEEESRNTLPAKNPKPSSPPYGFGYIIIRSPYTPYSIYFGKSPSKGRMAQGLYRDRRPTNRPFVLESKFLRGGYIGDYIGDHYRDYSGGYKEFVAMAFFYTSVCPGQPQKDQ